MIYKSENIRDVLILGHQGSGKTSLVEARIWDLTT